MDVIGFIKSLYEAIAINVAVLYENYTTLSILSLATRKSFPCPGTAVPVLVFPSLHHIKVYCCILLLTIIQRTLMPSTQILKQYFAIRPKLRNSFFCTLVLFAIQ